MVLFTIPGLASWMLTNHTTALEARHDLYNTTFLPVMKIFMCLPSAMLGIVWSTWCISTEVVVLYPGSAGVSPTQEASR
jgi:hypothetical protein